MTQSRCRNESATLTKQDNYTNTLLFPYASLYTQDIYNKFTLQSPKTKDIISTEEAPWDRQKIAHQECKLVDH